MVCSSLLIIKLQLYQNIPDTFKYLKPTQDGLKFGQLHWKTYHCVANNVITPRCFDKLNFMSDFIVCFVLSVLLEQNVLEELYCIYSSVSFFM